MLRYALLLLLLTPLAAQVPDAPKPVVDKKFIAFAALEATSQAADFYYTADYNGRMIDGTRVYETNPLFGKYPSNGRIIGENIAIFAGLTVAAYEMKKSHNKYVHALWWVPLLAPVAPHVEGVTEYLRMK